MEIALQAMLSYQASWMRFVAKQKCKARPTYYFFGNAVDWRATSCQRPSRFAHTFK